MSDFAARLKERRQQLSLSVKELAQQAGLSRSVVSKFENRHALPRLDIADRLAQALHTTLSDLLTEQPKARVMLIRKKDQPKVQAEAGHQWRILSPTLETPELHLARMEPGMPPVVMPPRAAGMTENIWVVSGSIELVINEETFHVHAGDNLFAEAHVPRHLRNAGNEAAEYLIVISR